MKVRHEEEQGVEVPANGRPGGVRRFRGALFVLVVGSVISVAGAVTAWNWEDRAVRGRYEAASENRIAAFERELIAEFSTITAFARHLSKDLKKNGENVVLAVEQVLPLDREDVGYYWITRESARGADERFACSRLSATDRPGLRTDFDAASDQGLLEALARCGDSGKIVTTSRLDSEDRDTGSMVLLLLPLYRHGTVPSILEQRRKLLLGFVATALPIGEVMERGMRYLMPYGIDVYAFDLSAPESESFLYLHWSRRRDPSIQPEAHPRISRTTDWDYERTLNVGGREWLVRCQPVPEKLATGYTWQPWGVLLGGMVITFLTAGSFRTQADRTARIEREIELRTRELSEANQRLRQEVHVRQKAQQELAVARDQALESSRLKSQFLANVSHEIRTPLNGILGMTGFLFETRLTAEQRELAETVDSSAKALLAIISDILDMSKIEAGKLNLTDETFPLLEVAQEVFSMLAGEARRKGLAMRLLVPPDVPSCVRGDPMRLRQVLANLLSNGVKFTDHGEVSLSIAREPDEDGELRLRFDVRDTGIGVDAESRECLFQRFTQVDGTSARRFGGTGLGLAISRQLVELMGGRIGVESTPGKGSTFWFTVRLKQDECNGASNCRDGAAIHGVHVVVASSSPVTRKVIQSFLEAEGVEITEVGTPAGAAKALEDFGGKDQVLILDVENWPESWEDLPKSVGPGGKLADAPVIVLRDRASAQDLRLPPAANVTWLNRPVKRKRLVGQIRRLWMDNNLPKESMTAPPVYLEASPCNVLLAEDNAVNQRVAIRCLERLGCRVTAVENGARAVAECEKDVFDLVLMDCQMPVIDGYEATRLIRERERDGKRTPIIALTANAMSGDRNRCLEADMDDYLPKPIEIGALADVIDRWGTTPSACEGDHQPRKSSLESARA